MISNFVHKIKKTVKESIRRHLDMTRHQRVGTLLVVAVLALLLLVW